MLLSIIVPVFNEEKQIKELISKLLKIDLSEINCEKEIIVINDGSTDNSKKIIEEFQNIKLLNQENEGKGSAVQNGIRNSKGDYVLIQDGDLEYDPNDIVNLCKSLKKNNSKQNLTSYLANILFVLLFLILYRVFITDPLTGYKLYAKEFFKKNVISSKGFEADHEITAKLIKQKYQIVEVPVKYNPRTKMEGKKINFFDALKAIKTIILFRFLN